MTSPQQMVQHITEIVGAHGANQITITLSAEDAVQLARDVEAGSAMRLSRWTADVKGAVK